MSKEKEVAVKEENTAPILYEGFEEFGGAGFGEVTTDDLAIPFLRILAQLSPQVNKRDGAYIEGAEAGHIYNTVLNEVYDGTKGIQVIPCLYQRRFVEWTPREKGGGYVQSYTPEDPIVATTTRDERGQDVLPNGNYLANTAHFFAICLHETLGPQRSLITMTSTQLKKARKWITQAQGLTAKGKNGVYTLPLMSQVYTLTSVQEQNDKGTWFGWEIQRERSVDLKNEDDVALFEMGLSFAKSVKAGEVEVKSEVTEPKAEADDGIPF
jgi:hypothetical protein|tara:strand:- start:14402 stop:15205 length:804 start_codon:yes stop_codon:yes gene_type:complete